ncbi:hypothetical protein P8452_14182 [Trifolium repens]|nr:hypothetical protein P8452_14182 [Trifolium repens]
MTKCKRLLELEKTMCYLLPKQLWCSFEQNKDGKTLSEVGWVLDHAITSTCPFSSTAKLKVWSLMRRFDQRQKYKPFISRLEVLDDNEHIVSIMIIGGDHRLMVLLTEGFRLKAISKDAVLLRCKVIAEPYDCGGPILLEVFQIGTGGLNGMAYIVMKCRNLSRISIMNFREQVNMCVISISLIYD